MAAVAAVVAAGLLAGGVVLGCGDTGSDVEGTSSTGGGSGAELAPRPAGDDPLPRPSDDEDATPVHGYRVLRSFPHDPQAFTQGLLYADGGFYESTGQYGESSLRFVELETGKVQRMRSLDSRLFAEGLAMVDRNLIQLTWRNRMALVFNAGARKLPAAPETSTSTGPCTATPCANAASSPA